MSARRVIMDPYRKGIFIGVFVVLSVSAPFSAGAQSNCASNSDASAYRKEPSDRIDLRHLAVSRPFSGSGNLDLTICAGEVRLLPSTDGRLHLDVELRGVPPVDLASYVTRLDVGSKEGRIQLAFTKAQRAFIALRIPSTNQLHSVTRLGAGELSARGDSPRGDRELEVGSGSITLYLKGNSQFASLAANVAIGSFHVRRPGGTSSHFAVKRVIEGSGRGQIAAEVGSGSINLLPEE